MEITDQPIVFGADLVAGTIPTTGIGLSQGQARLQPPAFNLPKDNSPLSEWLADQNLSAPKNFGRQADALTGLPEKASINFQPAGAPIPSGYAADTGAAFDLTRGYGWVRQDSFGRRATGRAACYSSSVTGWRSLVDVNVVGIIDDPGKLTTPSRNISCRH